MVYLQTVDVSCNRLPTLPVRLGSLRSVTHLRASHNQLELDDAAWPALASLTTLTRLMLDHNRCLCTLWCTLLYLIWVMLWEFKHVLHSLEEYLIRAQSSGHAMIIGLT